MDERELKTNDSKNDGVDSEPHGADEQIAREESDTKKLTTELEDMRQTLVRHQADFANYRKRIEKERSEDSKRSTARVIEALIPIVDGFEHALAAHREAEYENFRAVEANKPSPVELDFEGAIQKLKLFKKGGSRPTKRPGKDK